MEPVGALFVCTRGWERVLGRSDLDVVALLELDAPAPVERELNSTQIYNSIVSGSSFGRKEGNGYIGSSEADPRL